jgi:hypothetical protein
MAEVTSNGRFAFVSIEASSSIAADGGWAVSGAADGGSGSEWSGTASNSRGKVR